MNNRTISHFFGSFILGVAALMICHTTQAQQPEPICVREFSDPKMPPITWSAEKIVDTTLNQTANFNVSHLQTGGNLGSYRRTEHNYGFGLIRVAHLYKGFVYDPSSQGAINKVGYSYDLRHFTPPAGQAVAYQLLIFQNETHYGGPVNAIFNDAWQSFSNSNLTAASFTKIKGNGPTTPDFSCTGSKITFGYLTANSNPNPGTQSKRISGMDNWCLTITKAPPPPPLNPDFTLTGVIDSGNTTTFSLKAEPVSTNPTDTSFAWRVAEINAAGDEVSGTISNNPPEWWVVTTNTFTGYNSPPSSPGKFLQGKKYRITRGVWGPCNPMKAISKTVFMCTTCRRPKIEPDTFIMPKPASTEK